MNLPSSLVEEIALYFPLKTAISISNWSALNIYNPKIHTFELLIKKNQVEILKWLVQNNIELENIEICCEFGNLEILKLYNVEKLNSTSLDICCCNGHLECVEYLLERGIKSAMAIDLCSAGGESGVVKLLYENGFTFGQLAIDNACRNGHLDTLLLLYQFSSNLHMNSLATGSRPSVQALSMAAKNGHLQILQFILNNHSYSQQTIQTILEYACEGGQLQVAKMILNQFNFQFEFKYCLGFARVNGHLQIVEYLQKIGCKIGE